MRIHLLESKKTHFTKVPGSYKIRQVLIIKMTGTPELNEVLKHFENSVCLVDRIATDVGFPDFFGA